jgi:nucleotide-binding universal stress UspA family protein
VTRPVLVGWSGSEVSNRAVEVAAGFAERRGAPLRVVLGWDFLDQPGYEFDPQITPEKVQKTLEKAVAAVRARHPGVLITCDALMGWAPAVVCDAAEFADLLVLGRSDKSKGHFGDWSPDVLVRRVRIPVVYVP